MRRLLKPLLTVVPATMLAMVFWCARAHAQGVHLRVDQETSDGAVYELTASWPSSLQAALDSIDAITMDDMTAAAVARGGLFERTAALRLPNLATPRLHVVAADYEEVRIPLATDAGVVLEAVASTPAEIVGLGLARKRPEATLVTRLLTYNREEGILRRYRRLVVSVQYASQAALRREAEPTRARVTESVLSRGTVFKIKLSTEGIFRIDRAFLTSLPGFSASPGSLDPENIKVYGNGGAPLPALNRAPRPIDLIENQVFVQGGGDGSFDAGDAVWFYAEPPAGWKSVIQRDRRGDPLLDDQGVIVRHWEHYVHPFSNDNYYFIKIDDTESDAIVQDAYPDNPGAIRLSQFTGRWFHDMDDYMWSRESGTGHTWVSALIQHGGLERSIVDNVTLPGLRDGVVRYRVRAAVQANPAASIFFKTATDVLATVNFGPLSNASTNTIAKSGIVTFEHEASTGQPLNIVLELENRPGAPKAAVDWVRLFYPKALHASGGHLRFHTPIGAVGTFEMALTGFSATPMVWDITEPGNYRALGVRQTGGSHLVQVVTADPDTPRELIAFTPQEVQAINREEVCPQDPGCLVAAQNLHGIQSYPDFVIVTPDILKTQAEELAALRRQDGLVVEVVDVAHIYNEFSGGLTDFRGIRDYLRFLYERAPGEEQLLRYALMFGDGHFNYRELGLQPESPTIFPNLVPPFETEESWHPETSYTSDDYFGLLDPNEGLWSFTRESFIGQNEHLNERMDIGIGRFTVHTPEQAQTMLNKIRRYESADTFGPWRTRYLFIADDGPTGTTGTQDDLDLHTQNTDVVAEIVGQVAPEVNQKKVYAISYQREFRNIWRVPGARQDILTLLRDGVLVANFSGHGNEEGLAQEDLFNSQDARELENLDVLPIFITATCSFGRWDHASSQSGAEELLLNPDGGAIALLTTVRSVYTSGDATTLNVGLNVALNAEMFQRDADGLPRRLGDALRLTKNTRVGVEGNNRKFNLLGDPSMRIGLPARSAVVKTINGEAIDRTLVNLRALERVTVTGEVQLPDSTIDAGFSGVVSMTVFDAERRVSIPPHIQRHMRTPYYTIREDLIWRGRINTTQGRFTATFVVPKDISYSNKPGRISMYASSPSVDARGYTENIIVGGTALEIPDDSDGPQINIFLNDETFTDGGLTSQRPRVLVKLFDESGVNTVAAGVGHEMLLVLDDDNQNAIDIGEFYESEENSFQRGRIAYTFEDDLTPGAHTLSMRAWDVLNNSGTASVDFVVADDATLEVRNVFNYPNPTTGPSRFVFEHNQQPGTPVSVQVRIYSLSGRPVRTVEQDGLLPGGPMQVSWDGMDDDFDRLSPGIYLYKVRVEVDGSEGARQVSEAIERLAIVR